MKWSPLHKPVEDGWFYTLTADGKVVLRNLKKENEGFSVERYRAGEFDSYNFLYHENFEYYQWDSRGSDYERYGCMIKEGMRVMDLGANIGAFARYARSKGASEVFCFEPMTPTFHCLQLNTAHDEKIHAYKMGVSDKTEIRDFHIHTDYTHNGGGSMVNFAENSLDMHHSESCALLGIAEIFKMEKWSKIDFLKVDIEGAEQFVLQALPDAALRSLVCISCEFHSHTSEFEEFQRKIVEKFGSYGFKSFVLYHGDGHLRTVSFWKE